MKKFLRRIWRYVSSEDYQKHLFLRKCLDRDGSLKFSVRVIIVSVCFTIALLCTFYFKGTLVNLFLDGNTNISYSPILVTFFGLIFSIGIFTIKVFDKKLEFKKGFQRDNQILLSDMTKFLHSTNKDMKIFSVTELNRMKKEGLVDAITVSRLTGYGLDLDSANLSGADMSGMNLRNANLNNANLTNANFNNANLSGAEIGSANLTNTNFNNTNLSNANLSGAEIGGANFKKANLKDSFLNSASTEDKLTVFDGVRFDGANLSSANLSNCSFDSTDFGKSIIVTDTNFEFSKFIDNWFGVFKHRPGCKPNFPENFDTRGIKFVEEERI